MMKSNERRKHAEEKRRRMEGSHAKKEGEDAVCADGCADD